MPVNSRRNRHGKPAGNLWAVAAQLTVAGIATTLLVACTLSAAYEKKKPKPEDAALAGLPVTDLTAPQAIQHALDRLGYGPTPGEIESVQKMGLAKWIDQQLHPESINDSALTARLQKYPTLDMSSAKLLEQFPRPQLEAKREGITVEEYRRQQLQMAGGQPQTDTDTPPQAGQAGGNTGYPAAGGNTSGENNSANGTMNGSADGASRRLRTPHSQRAADAHAARRPDHDAAQGDRPGQRPVRPGQQHV